MPSGAAAPAPSMLSLWGPVVAYMALVFGLSSMPSPPAPANVWDKLLHALFYGGLALVTLRATAGGHVTGITGRAVMAAWAIATLYGLSDEVHQWFVPHRSADALDVVADAVGAALALGAAQAAGIILRSRAAAGRG